MLLYTLATSSQMQLPHLLFCRLAGIPLAALRALKAQNMDSSQKMLQVSSEEAMVCGESKAF